MWYKEQRKNHNHHVPSLQAASHHPDHKVLNHQSHQLKKERAIQVNVWLADLQAVSSLHPEEKICKAKS